MAAKNIRQCIQILAAGIVTATSCQTPPEGRRQLSASFDEYREKDGSVTEDIGKGRPIHIPGWAYGQITKNGDIWGGGPVLFYLGRESLDYDQIFQKTFLKDQ